MILALPFDLRLWTGVNGDEKVKEIYLRFADRRNKIQHLHQKIAASPVSHCLLRIPMTEALYVQLSGIPSWTDIRPGSHLHRFKRDVLALLRGKKGAAGLMLYMNTCENVYVHIWEDPADFFPPTLAPLQENWLEMVGMCAFEPSLSAHDSPERLPVLGCCVITNYTESFEARLTRCPVNALSGTKEHQRIPLLSQVDAWAWERIVRRMLWQDERLPFGPIGYCPPEQWQMGERPSRYGYCDVFGGVWQWEGGRAITERNPFGGHWNVQLPQARIKHRWVDWIQACTRRAIATRPELLSHINVEPDGQIADLTFSWQA